MNQIVNHRGRENAPQHQDSPGGGNGGGGGGGGGMPPMARGGGGGGMGGGGGGGLAVTVSSVTFEQTIISLQFVMCKLT